MIARDSLRAYSGTDFDTVATGYAAADATAAISSKAQVQCEVQ